MDLQSRDAPLTDHQVANTFDLTTGTATLAWAEAVGDGQVPDTRFAFGPDQVSVTAEATVSAQLDRSAFVRLAAALVLDGWEVGHRTGAVRRLFARRGALRLAASYAASTGASTGAFAVTVRSMPLMVGAGRARKLAAS
jgi:hypothetical protein